MNNRIIWIDILKTFAIFSVVMGHMISCEAFSSNIGVNVYQEFILAFHMPLFTVLSGWFFSAKRSAKDFLQVKSFSILLPYIVWCFVWFLARPLVLNVYTGQDVHLSSIIWQAKFFLNEGLLCYGWWFLRGLLFTLLLAYCSVKLAERCGKTIAEHAYAWGGCVSCVVLYILCFSGIIPNQPDKDSLLKGFIYMYPFFWSGYLLRWIWERKQETLESNRTVICVTSCFMALLLWWDGIKDPFYGMNTSVLELVGANGVVGFEVFYRTVFRLFIGVIGSLSFLLIFNKLFRSEYNNRFRVLCQNIGKETLGIYILQSLVYWSLPNYDVLGWGEWGNFLFASVLSIVIIMVSYVIIKYTSKMKWFGLLMWGKKF